MKLETEADRRAGRDVLGLLAAVDKLLKGRDGFRRIIALIPATPGGPLPDAEQVRKDFDTVASGLVVDVLARGGLDAMRRVVAEAEKE